MEILYICDGCGKVYWDGSHYDRIWNILDDFKSSRARERKSIRPVRPQAPLNDINSNKGSSGSNIKTNHVNDT